MEKFYKFSEELLANNTFIPVVVLNDETKAIPLANALLKGGIKIMEITFRTKNAPKIIEKIVENVPDIVVGAGTILNADSYHIAVKHGANFIVSPGLTKELVDVASHYDIPLLPGAITPTEVMQAIDYGFNCLKFFPAEGFNGLNILKAYSQVFSEVKFCPTGGITLDNAKNYLGLKNVTAVGCSFLAQDSLINNNDFAAITDIARKTSLILG